ncbi:hypothetical protein FA95DRAFT_1565077, partial [Auriscalpium vulgare]
MSPQLPHPAVRPPCPGLRGLRSPPCRVLQVSARSSTSIPAAGTRIAFHTAYTPLPAWKTSRRSEASHRSNCSFRADDRMPRAQRSLPHRMCSATARRLEAQEHRPADGPDAAARTGPRARGSAAGGQSITLGRRGLRGRRTPRAKRACGRPALVL